MMSVKKRFTQRRPACSNNTNRCHIRDPQGLLLEAQNRKEGSRNRKLDKAVSKGVLQEDRCKQEVRSCCVGKQGLNLRGTCYLLVWATPVFPPKGNLGPDFEEAPAR